MRPVMKPAREEMEDRQNRWTANPIKDGIPYAFRDFKLNWSLCLALDDRNSLSDMIADHEVSNP